MAHLLLGGIDIYEPKPTPVYTLLTKQTTSIVKIFYQVIRWLKDRENNGEHYRPYWGAEGFAVFGAGGTQSSREETLSFAEHIGYDRKINPRLFAELLTKKPVTIL